MVHAAMDIVFLPSNPPTEFLSQPFDEEMVLVFFCCYTELQASSDLPMVHMTSPRVLLLCMLALLLASTPAMANLSPGEQIALNQLFEAFPSLSFAPFDINTPGTAWSNRFDNLCIPGNQKFYFGLTCTPDGHVGSISFDQKWGRMSPNATLTDLSGLAWVNTFIVGSFSEEPFLSVPPELVSRLFQDLPLTTLAASSFDLASYRLISGLKGLKSLAVVQDMPEMLDLSGFTQLTMLHLENAKIENLSHMAPVAAQLQNLMLVSAALTNLDGLGTFSNLLRLTLTFSASVSSVSLPNGLQYIVLSCIGGSSNLTTLNIPNSANWLQFTLPSLVNWSIPEGVTTLMISSVSCNSGVYPTFPTTLKSFSGITVLCNFPSFAALTQLNSFAVSSSYSDFSVLPDLSNTALTALTVNGPSSVVTPEALCSVPNTIKTISISLDDALTYLPACLLTKPNLIGLTLAPRTALLGQTVFASLSSNVTLSRLTSFSSIGTIGYWPAAVTSMTNLQSLSMGAAALNVEFPNEQLSHLPLLQTLSLVNAGLYGTIDSDFFTKHPGLTTLYLAQNVGLNGTFPTANMQNLQMLNLGYTHFTHFPDPNPSATALSSFYMDYSSISNFPSRQAWLNMTSLKTLRMTYMGSFTAGSDAFPGHAADDLPDFWATHPTLNAFLATGAGLNGTMPNNVTAPYLRTLDLSSNLLTGFLPTSWGETEKRVVATLNLNRNLLQGTVPFWLGNLGFMRLNLAQNKLTGCISSQHISEATRSFALSFELHSNNLYGPLPDLSRLNSLGTLDFSDNGFDMCYSNPHIQLSESLLNTCNFSMSFASVASGEGSSCDCLAFFQSALCSSNPSCGTPSGSGPAAPTSPMGLCSLPPAPSPSPPFVVVYSPSCPLPQPEGVWYCDAQGTWQSTGSIEQPSLSVPSDIHVNGNLTISSSVTFSGINSTIYVQGCVFLTGGQIIVTLSPEELQQAKHLQKTLIQSSTGNDCDGATDLSQVVVIAKTTKSTCKKVKVNSKDSSSKGTLNAVFSIDSSSCNTWWIILVSVIGGVILIAIAMMLLVTFNETLKKKVRPFWVRTQKNAQSSP